MGTPFKMKGFSGFKESPVKGKGDNLYRIAQEKKALKIARGEFYAPGAAPQPKTPNVPGFNVTGSKEAEKSRILTKQEKLGQFKQKFSQFQSKKQKAKDWAKRILKKGSTKTFGFLGLMGGDPLSATASDVRTKTEGEQIKDLLTKHKLKGGR